MYRLTKMTAAVLTVASIAAPAAGAQPVDPPRPPATAAVNAGAPPQVTTSSSDGFDWGDAGIGAAAALTLAGVGAGTVLVVRRGRERHPVATS